MPLIDTPPDAVRELAQYRTLHSKRFDLGNGFHRIVHKLGRVHFQDDDGSLQDIETDLTVDQATGDVIATRLPFRFRMLKQGIGYAFQSRSGGTVICQLRRVGTTAIDTSATFTPQRIGNKLIYQDVATDLDIIIQVNRNGIQTWRRLKSANAAKSWRWGIQYDADGQAKIDPTIRGFDGTDPQPRVLNGLAITDSQAQDNGDGTFTILRQETWDGTVITRDPQTRVPSVTSDPVYPVWIDPDVTAHVSSDADDGYENMGAANWNSYFFGGYGKGIKFGSYFQQYNPGWRFQNIAVAQGATISLAQLKINALFNFSHNAVGGSGTLYGAAEDNAAAWSAGTRPSTRTKTAHSTAIPAIGDSHGLTINTFTCTSIVQDIVSRGGWVSNNSIALFMLAAAVAGTHITSIEAYENTGTNEAVLEITLAAAAAFNPYYYRFLAGSGSGMNV